jgi:spore coat protein U-like protein
MGLFRRTVAALVAFLAVALATQAQAAGSSPLAVSANVLARTGCSWIAGGSTALNFGSLDPNSATDVTATAQPRLRCTGNSASVLISLTHDSGLYETGPGANRMRHSTTTTEFLPYTTNLPNGVFLQFVPTNVDLQMNLTGTVRATDFRSARVGTYNDTITFTITP